MPLEKYRATHPGVATVRERKEGARAEVVRLRSQHAVVVAGDVECDEAAEFGHRRPHRGREGVHTGLGDEEDPEPVESARRVAERFALAQARDRSCREPADPGDCRDRRRPADAVRGGARVALELPDRSLGLSPENAVFASRIEAEKVQPSLQLGDVVTAQHRAREVEQPVPELEATFDEGSPRLGSADAVDPQAALLLEVAHRVLE